MPIFDSDFTGWCLDQGIVAVYRHGSTTRGQARPDSDMDLAVLMKPSRSLSLYQETALAQELEKRLKPFLKTHRQLDIRFLRGTPPAFQYQVLKSRDLLWEGNPQDRVKFERDLMREYMDFRFYEEQYQKALKERLREGSFGRRPQIRK